PSAGAGRLDLQIGIYFVAPEHFRFEGNRNGNGAGFRPMVGSLQPWDSAFRMRHRPTRTLRRWAAALLVAAYAFGALAPAIAFARADRDAVAHVLSETPCGTLTLHFHGDEERHEDSGHGGKLGHHCCGIVSLVGIEPANGRAIIQPMMTRLHVTPAAQ